MKMTKLMFGKEEVDKSFSSSMSNAIKDNIKNVIMASNLHDSLLPESVFNSMSAKALYQRFGVTIHLGRKRTIAPSPLE
jgi:hypothetical protein